jgi:uncharacterized protein (UPF0261 family)
MEHWFKSVRAEVASDKAYTETIAIVATLDTKGLEVDFLKNEIQKSGFKTLVVDVGVLNDPLTIADFSRKEIAELGGGSLNELVGAAERGADRSAATAVMTKGAIIKINEIFSQGSLQGIVSLGGSTGAAIGISTMKSLPLGVPKLMICTRLDHAAEVGEKDFTVMQTPADILGLNRIMKRSLRQGAGAIVGMIRNSGEELEDVTKPMVGITALGVTTPLVLKLIPLLEKAGYEVVVFHNRAGNLEELVKLGSIKGIIDLSLGELVWAYVANIFPERKSRLEIVKRVSIPMVIVPGSLDMIILTNLRKEEDVPRKYKNRILSKHGPSVTLVSTDLKETEILAKVIAEKANSAKGPVTILIPFRGFSSMDKKGQAFYNPARVETFVNTVKKKVKDHVQVVEMDKHINDHEFAQKLFDTYLSMERRR